MDEDKNMQQPQQLQTPEEQEIDLMELALKLWAERKWIIKMCCIAAVIGVIVAFSIPREYSTTVTLAPESTGKGGGGMNSLAAMVGINLSSGSSGDALSPELYPDIVNSTPFLIDLFDVRVQDKKARIDTTLYAYMNEHQRAPWWSAILSAPVRVLGWTLSLFREKEEVEGDAQLDPFRLTLEEAGVAKALSTRIGVAVDKKTGVTTLSVMMQDPLISASVTDTVMRNLQRYITDYRTNKARHDLAFADKLYQESKKNYEVAQSKYANFVDANKNIVQLSFRVEQERLQNEVNLAYQNYSQMSQQLQLAKAKVQEITPVYTVVQPASVPLRPVKPSKMMILVGFVFMAFAVCAGWILYGRDYWANLKNQLKGETV